MGQLLLVRHGQASLLKTYYDDLSDRGREQATALGEFFATHGWGFDAVYSGPARRHLDTARQVGELAALGDAAWPKAQTVAGLDDHDALSLVRASVASLREDPEVVPLRKAMLAATSREERSERFQSLFEVVVARWLSGDFEPQGVETWPQFRARVLSGIEAIVGKHRDDRVLAFSSLGPVAVLLQRALGLSDLDAFRIGWRLRNTSLTQFLFDERGALSVDYLNALPHLPDRERWTLR